MCIVLPYVARDFIDKFDFSSPQEREAMDEVEFVIDIEEDIINSIGITDIRKHLKNSKTLKVI